MKEGNVIKKLLKYCLIIIILYFMFFIWYSNKFSTINVLNSNCNLNLPKPKSVDNIINAGWQNEDDFSILYYTERDLDEIKMQINNYSMDELKQKFYLFKEHFTIEEREILEKNFNSTEIDEKNLYYAYFQRRRGIGSLIIFDELEMKLYYLQARVEWTID